VGLAAPGGHREHLAARVDAGHRTVGADLLEQLRDVEARPAAGVEDPLAGLRVERLVNQRAPSQQVPLAVDLLELPDGALVEGQLGDR